MNIAKTQQNLVGRISGWDLSILIKIIMSLGLILALTSSYLWYSRLYMTDERIFWAAIENSMSTSSVTRTVNSGGSGNGLTQQHQLVFSPNPAIASKVTVANASATENISVVTEGRNFLDAQYSRYTELSIDRNGQPSVGVGDLLNKWESIESGDSDPETVRLNYLGELVTLVVFGNYDPDYRREMISNMKESGVYSIDLASTQDSVLNNEESIVYAVTVNLKGYVAQLNKAFVDAGFGEFPALNPDNYEETSEVRMQVHVVKRTGSIAQITYAGREESFSAYGIYREVDRPVAEFGAGELERAVQQRLQP